MNVKAQQGQPDSLWRCYQRLLRLRAQSPALHGGTLQLWDAAVVPYEVLAYRRVASQPAGARADDSAQRAPDKSQTVDVLLNFSSSDRTVELSRAPAEILFSTHGQTMPTRRVQLRPYESVVLRPG